MVTASRSKNLRGSRDTADPLPPSLIKRVQTLEASLAAVRRELRAEKVGFIADLKVAMGTLAASQRDGAIREMVDSAKFPDETLTVVRDELLKIFARLANIPPPQKSELPLGWARSEAAYVA